MQFLLIHETRGVHTRARLFTGPDDEHFAFCGEFTMRSGEWGAFRDALSQGADMLGTPVAFREAGRVFPGAGGIIPGEG
jgi:hypothetical protein